MSEKDLELLITLDAPQEEEDDPHYQLEMGNTGGDNTKSAPIVEQHLPSDPAGKR